MSVGKSRDSAIAAVLLITLIINAHCQLLHNYTHTLPDLGESYNMIDLLTTLESVQIYDATFI